MCFYAKIVLILIIKKKKKVKDLFTFFILICISFKKVENSTFYPPNRRDVLDCWGGDLVGYQSSTNCQQIFIDLSISSSGRLANQRWLKHIWAMTNTTSMYYSLVTSKAYFLYHTTENKMATQIPTLCIWFLKSFNK